MECAARERARGREREWIRAGSGANMTTAKRRMNGDRVRRGRTSKNKRFVYKTKTYYASCTPQIYGPQSTWAYAAIVYPSEVVLVSKVDFCATTADLQPLLLDSPLTQAPDIFGRKMKAPFAH